MERGGGVSPMSREQAHVAVQVPGSRKHRLRGSKAGLQVCTLSALGLCLAN